MRLQVLSSGSKGNATLLRAGEACVLVDAGLGPRNLKDRLDLAQLGPRALDHVVVTHGHLDHSRSAGAVARRHDATVHCAPSLLTHRAVVRAPRLSALPVGGTCTLEARGERVELRTARLPHDCDPTVGVGLEHAGRRAVVLTDLGVPDPGVARALSGAHVLVLEFNYDPGMLAAGPYPERLKERIRGGRGHLSNEQAAEMLRLLAGPELHTVVLAHLSAHNNTQELARAAAEAALSAAGRDEVRVLVALQDEPLQPIPV
jgi:phosphoribosyl 1,2-cyclic phosphodiesterase